MSAPFLTQPQEIELIVRWQQRADQRALERLVKSHAPLVRKMARSFARYGADLADLDQAGAIGLVVAANKFDIGAGVRFATYALWWIRAELQGCVLSTAMIQRVKTNKGRRMHLHTGAPPVLSLDMPLNRDGKGGTVIDTMATDAPSPADVTELVIDEQRRARALREAVATLPPRERTILEKRHLAESSTGLAELGEEFGVSKERVRQLETRAIAAVRERLSQTGLVPA